MINIKEGKSSHVVGEYSLYINFPYDTRLVNIMHTADGATYDKKNKSWEAPVTNLRFLINEFRIIDSIHLELLNHKDKKENVKKYDLLNYKLKPFPHQEDAIQYGLNHDKWMLLDAPGLGKTASMLHLAEELKARGKINHCLIVCGLNSLKLNWLKEVYTHTNETARVLGQRFKKKTGEMYVGGTKERLEDLKNPIPEFFVITNIETLRSDDIIKALTKGKVNKFDMIVADEVHCMKNPSSQQGKNFLKLKDAKYKVALTGTLLLNSPFDSFVALKWLGIEKCSFSNFKYFYGKFGGYFGNEIIGYRNINYLKDVLDNNSLRRVKDTLDLPPKTVIDEIVEMDDTQNKFYNNIVNGIVDQVDKVYMSTTNLLGMMARLRQATACPSYLTTENISSAKIERAIDLLCQFTSQKEKVVVFSVFKETLYVLQHRIKKELGIDAMLCTGDVGDETISQNIDKFQNDTEFNYPILLATEAKMGTGVTLTAASTEIFMDVPYTQAVFEQCQDRCYRIGTTKPVFIYHLITKDTVDERIRDIVETKGMISDYIVDDKINDTLKEKLLSIITDLKEG